MPGTIITMPAYRAALTLEKTVLDIPSGVADELLLVDDASPDATADIATSLGLTVYVHPVNRGYGGNQKTCYSKALLGGADIVAMLHPDYQYDPKAVPLLVAAIHSRDADMTFGSRFAGLGDPRKGGMPMYRFIGNRLTTIAENVILGSRFTETHSGMRAYTRRCLMSLPFLGYSDDFAFDSQFLADAVTSGLRVVEVPILTRYTKESSSVGVGRSLVYVAQSLSCCARRVHERGRRGKRNPVVSHGAPTRSFAFPIPPRSAPETQELQLWVDAAAREYFTSGDRTIWIEGKELSERADRVLANASFAVGDQVEEELVRSAKLLDMDGVLAILLRSVPPEAALTNARLRLVEVRRVPRRLSEGGPSILALARSTDH